MEGGHICSAGGAQGSTCRLVGCGSDDFDLVGVEVCAGDCFGRGLERGGDVIFGQDMVGDVGGRELVLHGSDGDRFLHVALEDLGRGWALQARRAGSQS